MNNWYTLSLPTIKEATVYVNEVAQTIKAIPGVTDVCAIGSFADNIDKIDYPIKDINLIAVTNFDSGDLMAIDAGPYSPLKMASNELEDYGFDPAAVIFTKKYTQIKKYNLDHWASSSDDKLLHWGAIPESIEEWQDVHLKAEQYATKITGYNRLKVTKQSETSRQHWQEAFSYSVSKAMGKQSLGWYPSDHPASETLKNAKRIV